MISAWNTIVIVGCAALLFFTSRKEMLRANKARLTWRMIASVIAVVCLACMALPLTYTKADQKTGKEIIVETEGVGRDTILSFKKNKKQSISILEKEDFLSTERNDYDSIHIFGFGFTKSELLRLNKRAIVFHPAAVKTGIIAANWNRQLKKGEVLAVQGSYVNESTQPVRLLLNGFNTVVDSVTILSQQTKTFTLRTVPKQNGRAVFSMIALQGKDTLEKEPVPVEVGEPNGLKVMILAAAPDFENKFLKTWLSQNGYAVVTKTNISANKFDRSVLNTGKLTLDHITSPLLDSFDIVVSDEASLSMLPGPEREAVYRQVNSKGMGLIIRGDTISAAREWYTRPFRLVQIAGKQPTHLSLSFAGNGGAKAVLPVEHAQFLRVQNGMQVLVKDSASNAMAAVITEGSGKILFTTLANTYSWVLSGNTVDYYSLWNLLLQKVGRQNNTINSFGTEPVFPTRQEPVQLVLQTKSDSSPVVQTGQSQPAFVQDQLVPYRWQTTWWPKNAGWQEPLVFEGRPHEWYVYEKNDWSYVRAGEKTNATKNYVKEQQNSRETVGGEGATDKKPVSLFLFFLPFIICSGFLWLERKIS